MVGAALGVSSTRILHFFFSLRSRPTISVEPVGRVWYDEGWRVNVAFPAFHQREPITVEQVHEPIFGRYTGNECVVDVGSKGHRPVLLVQNEIDTITDASG